MTDVSYTVLEIVSEKLQMSAFDGSLYEMRFNYTWERHIHTNSEVSEQTPLTFDPKPNKRPEGPPQAFMPAAHLHITHGAAMLHIAVPSCNGGEW